MLPTLGLFAGLLLGALDPSHVGLLFPSDTPVVRGPRLLLPEASAADSLSLWARVEETAPATGPAASSRERARRVYRPLRYATAGSLLVTGTLGTLVAINQQTSFSTGRCNEVSGPRPIFGVYGCDALNIVHGISGVLSAVLYTATVTVGSFAGEPPFGHQVDHGRLHRILSYVALVGLAIQPLLGLVSAYPQILGVAPRSRAEFSKVTRTVHLGIGYVTIASYLTTVVLEF